MDVVDAGVGIFDDDFLAGLNRQNLRRIKAAFLVQHGGRRARAGGFAGDTLQRNHHVGQLAIRADDIKMRGGRLAVIHRGAIRIVHERRDFLFRRRRALEGDDANDVRAQAVATRPENPDQN